MDVIKFTYFRGVHNHGHEGRKTYHFQFQCTVLVFFLNGCIHFLDFQGNLQETIYLYIQHCCWVWVALLCLFHYHQLVHFLLNLFNSYTLLGTRKPESFKQQDIYFSILSNMSHERKDLFCHPPTQLLLKYSVLNMPFWSCYISATIQWLIWEDEKEITHHFGVKHDNIIGHSMVPFVSFFRCKNHRAQNDKRFSSSSMIGHAHSIQGVLKILLHLTLDLGVERRSFRWWYLPRRSNFTSLAAFSPSILRFLSIILDRSAAALSSALVAHPMATNKMSRVSAA